MSLKCRLAAVALALVVWTSTAVQAGPIAVDGGWHAFGFDGVGSVSSDGPFTFTAVGPVTLSVVDAFLSGDQFNVLDFGGLLGPTSVPLSTGDQISSDYDGALADPRWSSGVFALGAGSYSIDIEVVTSPFGGGGAALRVDSVSAVPEPASMTLIGIGALGMVLRSYRRRSRQQAT